VTELRRAFEEALNDYLEACEKLGRVPQKPYSGKLMLRVPPKCMLRLLQRPKSAARVSISGP